MIESIDSKLISVCLIDDHSLIADLHIFVYGRAEFASISLEYTKVKLLLLNNFSSDGWSRYVNLFFLPHVCHIRAPHYTVITANDHLNFNHTCSTKRDSTLEEH